MTFKKIYRLFFSKPKDFFTALIIGFSIASFIFLAFLQRHFFSYRYLAYTILIGLLTTIIVGWLNLNVLRSRLDRMTLVIKRFTVLITIFLSIILLLNIKIEPVYYVLPDSTLEISFTINQLPENEEGIRLLWIETGQGYVPYTYIDYDGQWERIFGNTIFSPGQSVTLRWTGKIGTEAEIAFRRTNFIQLITISWNGVSRTENIQGNNTDDFYFRENFDVPFFYFLPFTFSFFITSFYLIFLTLIWIGNWQISSSKKHPSRAFSWLKYSIPMLLLWSFILLVLWPGILTNDSLSIWFSAEKGVIDDWQSAFYTYLISLLMRIIPSPAFILFLQIVCFALTVAWGLSIFQKIGVPPAALWMISLLMAIFPPSILYVVTLWKDIPYAISLLAFTIAILAIVASKGKWGAEKHHWIFFGIIAFLVSIFRHNGGPVALITLIILIFVFKKQWKTYAGSLFIALLIFLIVRGPLYNQITIQNSNNGQSNLIYLHHIAAHLDAGTHFTDEEEKYLNSFLPINEWDYTCCYVGNISYDRNFERESFLSNTAENQKLAFNLFKRAPLVDINHAFCAGEMSYQFMNNQQCWHMKSLHGFINTKPGKEDWIGEPNRSNISEASFFPPLVELLILALRPFGIFDSSLVFYLRPAFWLFISFLSISVLVIRRDNISIVLSLLPALGQSALLFLIAFATAFRYYYGNCLIGIILLGCIFIPGKKETGE